MRCDRVIGSGFVVVTVELGFLEGIAVGRVCDHRSGAAICAPVTPVCVLDDGVTCRIGPAS